MTKLIAPGPTITGLNRKFFEDHPEDLKARIQSIPIGRMGQPQDHVGAALLLSPSLADLGSPSGQRLIFMHG